MMQVGVDCLECESEAGAYAEEITGRIGTLSNARRQPTNQ